METGYNGYITFYGPTVDEGSIDIEKAGKVLSSTAKVFQKYVKILIDEGKIEKLETGQRIILKTNAIKNNCTTIELSIGIVGQILASEPVGVLTTLQVGKTVFDYFGLKEFCKQFMGTLGKQLALKVFSRGKSMEIVNQNFDEKEGVEVVLKNELGEKKNVALRDRNLYLTSQGDVSSIFALEKDKEEEMSVGYNEGENKTDTGKITYEDKAYFCDKSSYDVDKKLSEPFEEDKSFDQMIVGRFIDYFGLAHKYYFSFQARRQQKTIGKQKILCMIDKNEISKILDLLKPENEGMGNIIIVGKATKDNEGKIDKIKIESIHTKGDSLFSSLDDQIVEEGENEG